MTWGLRPSSPSIPSGVLRPIPLPSSTSSTSTSSTSSSFTSLPSTCSPSPSSSPLPPDESSSSSSSSSPAPPPHLIRGTKFRRLSWVFGKLKARRSSKEDENQQAPTLIEEAINTRRQILLLATSEERYEDLAGESEYEPEEQREQERLEGSIVVTRTERFEDEFDCVTELGSGHFSQVFSCTRKSDGNSFAAKKLEKNALGLKEDLVKNEIDIHQTLNHPNIARLIKVFETETHWILVMELAAGGELFHLLDRAGPLGEKRSKEVAKRLLRAVAYLHNKHIVHRDIKPENILFRDPDSNDVLLSDFGLSARIKVGETLKSPCGSFDYVAPEVLCRAPEGYDQKSDMWSIGVVIFSLLCGYQPFHDEDEKVQLRAIVKGSFTFHYSAWRFISHDAKDLIRKLLKVDPDARLSAQEALNHPWFES